MLTIEPDRLDLAPDETVLDLGCGEGRHLHGAHAHADVRSVGLDIDRERLDRTRQGFADIVPAGGEARADLVVGDACTLPFPDDAFDVVICSEVLEHLPTYETALDEIARVLRPGGRLGVSVPRYGPERLCWALSDGYHEVDGGHVRIFRRSELEDALSRRDLTGVDDDHAHALHSPLWWLKCLWWERDEPPRPLASYQAFLDRVVTSRTPIVDRVERLLDPLMGKSVVLYREAR